jgi:hypothetical protein
VPWERRRRSMFDRTRFLLAASFVVAFIIIVLMFLQLMLQQ